MMKNYYLFLWDYSVSFLFRSGHRVINDFFYKVL